MSGASFTSAPMTKDFTISGPLMADLWISATRPDTTLIATLTDVHPDGTSDRVTAGSLVASLGDVTATPCAAKVIDCSLYFDGVPVVPWHPYTSASQKMLTAGQPTELKIEIFPTSLVVQPGHRLRLSITTGDLPHQGPNASTLVNSIGGTDTIYFGGKTPSSVYVGAVKDVAAASVAADATGQVAAATATLPFTAAPLGGRDAPMPAAIFILVGGLLLLLAGPGIRRRIRRQA
jgi:hypothetical protein